MSQPSNESKSRERGPAKGVDEGTAGEPGGRPGPVPLKGPQSLERLRERVQAAAWQLERLRGENAALAERIRVLEARRPVPEGPVPGFDEDPEVLRRKIEGFVSTIDAYLAREKEQQ